MWCHTAHMNAPQGKRTIRRPGSRKPPKGKTAQLLVDAALELIERNGGCRGVNLRQIAKRAKCAHTNLYNYHDSLEALFWAAMARALERHAIHTAQQLDTGAGKKSPLRTFLATQLDYAQEHPGLYRLVWIEPLSGQPSEQALQRLDAMRLLWVRQIAEHLHGRLPEPKLVWVGQIVHGYFHGEVCKLISRHAFRPKSSDDHERILANTLRLAELAAA